MEKWTPLLKRSVRNINHLDQWFLTVYDYYYYAFIVITVNSNKGN